MKRACIFTFRYDLEHNIDVKDQGHFNVKLIFRKDPQHFDHGNKMINFMFRYDLELSIKVKDQGHFIAKLILQMEIPYFDHGNRIIE